MNALKRTLIVAAVGALSLGTQIRAENMPRIKWVSYRSDILHARLSVPSAWEPRKTPRALAFRTPGTIDIRAGVGLMRSTAHSIEEAASQQWNDHNRPEDWVRSLARVNDYRAIKIVGSAKGQPGMKMVQYYIETMQGIYLLQCIAPAEAWTLYSPVFNKILTSFQPA